MKKNNSSYNQIIKSTSIFGGSQIVTILIGIIRAKIVALLIGPAGIGIIGIYQSVIEMIRTGSGLGIDTGAIREIARDNNANDKNLLLRTISIFNRWFHATALLGLITSIILCYPISLWAFDSTEFAMPVALLSICVYLITITTGKAVVLQGMRKISYLAQATIWGGLVGLIISIPLFYFLKLDGIILTFIAGSLVLYFCTDFYYRKLNIETVGISNNEAFKAGISTLKLGLFIVIAGIINTVSMFLIRAFLNRNLGIDAAGLFQSAWAITNVYLGLILKSMGSDFFPRLSAIANDRNAVKTLVNEQSYVVLIIALPIIVGMLLFSDFALSVLYSSKFTEASAVLQWQILGTFFKVLGWPIAFIMLSKNKGLLFLLSELIFYVVYLLSSYLLYSRYGLDAAGIGYLVAYLVYLPTVLLMGWYISGFVWESNIMKMILISFILISITFYIVYYQANHIVLLGSAILLISLFYAFFNLRKVFSVDDFKNWFKKK